METPKIVPKDANTLIEFALVDLARTLSTLYNETSQLYLWKWEKNCRGLQGKALVDYLRTHRCNFEVVKTERDALTSSTSIVLVFAKHLGNGEFYKRAARLTYRVVGQPASRGASAKAELAFSHVEIPFPSDIQPIKT